MPVALGAVAVVLYLHDRRRRATPAAPVAVEPVAGDVPVVISLPDSSEEWPDATVLRWFKRAGDRVEAGEPLVEIELAKAEFELPASVSGVLRRIDVAAGETAPAGAVLAVIEPAPAG